MTKPAQPLRAPKVEVYTVPTDAPESDGTLAWEATTIVVVHVAAAGATGIGYTYADEAAAAVIAKPLSGAIEGREAMDVPACWLAMQRAVRNLGRSGIAAMAIAAVDSALWDLKAKLLGVPLVHLMGSTRPSVPVYGSGGFTSYSIAQLQRQLAGWADHGIRAVKMKVGRDPERDPERVMAARRAVGDDTALYVDANGAYSRQQALAMAERFADFGVTWFEEPVSSVDLDGLHWLRGRVPARIEIAAGEYGYTSDYFRRMLAADAVDVQQADATRCMGPSGFLAAGALCQAFQTPLSAHTAPSVHLAPCCSVEWLRNLEYFHDHVRIEGLLFDGAVRPRDGELWPNLDRAGAGFELKVKDARRYAA